MYGLLGGKRRLALAVLVVTAAAVVLISPAQAGDATVQIAPTAGPPGTPITLTVAPTDACALVSWTFTIVDPRYTPTASTLRAWNVGTATGVPAPPADAAPAPEDGYQLFLGVGCFGADGRISQVACAEVRLLPAGAAATGSETAPFVSATSLLDSERSPSKCERQNALPAVLMPSHMQSIIARVNSVWLALLGPVAATSTTSTTQVPVPITPPPTLPPPTTTATTAAP